MTASGQIACALGIPFLTPGEGSTESGPAADTRPDSEEEWQAQHQG